MYPLYCINCGCLLLQCLSTHPWWMSTFSILQRPKSTSTKLLGSSLGRDLPPRRGLIQSSSAHSLGMDMNPPLSTAGTHTPMGMVMAMQDCTTIRTDMWEDASRKRSMDRYSVKSLKHTMSTVSTSWCKPPGVSYPIIGVETTERKCYFTSDTSTFPSHHLQDVGPQLWFMSYPACMCSDHTGHLMFYQFPQHKHVMS